MKIVLFSLDEDSNPPQGIIQYDLVPPKLGNVFPEDAVFIGLAEDDYDAIPMDLEDIIEFLIDSNTESRVDFDGNHIDIQELAVSILNLTQE
jgi:hypothetical protein